MVPSRRIELKLAEQVKRWQNGLFYMKVLYIRGVTTPPIKRHDGPERAEGLGIRNEGDCRPHIGGRT